MGALLDKPITEKETVVGQGNDLSFGASGMQGWRPIMEDNYEVIVELPLGLYGLSLFCVYDGHGGAFTSDYIKEHMMRVLTSMYWYRFDGELPAPSLREHPVGLEILKQFVIDTFLELDREMLREEYSSRWCGVDPRSGKTKIDESGCTCCLVFVTPQHIVCASAGDSRACYRTRGKTIQLSFDHKPHHDQEQTRIEAAGGYVSMQRVEGDLEYSRGLGDFRYKENLQVPPHQQKVSCMPDFCVVKRDAKYDEFLVVASDGIWNVMNCAEAADTVQSIFDEGETDAGIVAEELLDIALEKEKKHHNNLSAVVVTFPSVRIAKVGGGVEARRKERRRQVEGERKEQRRKDQKKGELKNEAKLARLKLLARARRDEEDGDSDIDLDMDAINGTTNGT
jgi:serine/threonine protein phosphatase PrpC